MVKKFHILLWMGLTALPAFAELTIFKGPWCKQDEGYVCWPGNNPCLCAKIIDYSQPIPAVQPTPTYVSPAPAVSPAPESTPPVAQQVTSAPTPVAATPPATPAATPAPAAAPTPPADVLATTPNELETPAATDAPK